MATRRHVVSVTTAADGTATAYSSYLSGSIVQISYVKPGSGNFDDGVDFTITAEATGQTLWTESNVNATKHCMPRGPTHSTAGVALVYAATDAVADAPRLGRDRVKIVIAQGGNAKTGAFHILVQD